MAKAKTPKAPGFWASLSKPFFCLAPMADVTDAPFRRIIAKYGKPDVMWTEFVSADGLCSRGRDKLLKSLKYTAAERPIVAQVFGAKPENFFAAAKIIKDLGFDGLDINMGCPEKSISGKQCAGSALIKNPKLAQEIILAAKAGAGKMPVSVKTRIGFSKNEIETWLPALLAAKPAAITIHARTKKEMSKVPADWSVIKRAVEIARGSGVLIIGNGDVTDLADAKVKASEAGCDGVMIGRAVFGNPWLFNRKMPKVSLKKKLAVLLEHTKLFEKLLGQDKPLELMKKHYKAYVSGFPGAAELRQKLMETKNSGEVEEVIKKYMVYGM